jgi:hypothetical protein
MSFFQKRAPEPPALPAPPKSPVTQMSNEQRARELAWNHLDNATTAAAAHMDLGELRAFIERRYFPTPEQTLKLLAAMQAPIGGLETIRRQMAARIHPYGPDWGPNQLNRPETPSSGAHARRVRAFVDGQDDALTAQDISEFLGPTRAYNPQLDRVETIDRAIPTGPPPGPWTGGSNVPSVNEMTIAHYRKHLAQLEAVVEANGK